MGYRYVEPDQSPDLVFTLDGASVYQEHYVPARNVVVPRWVPGQTFTTIGSQSGTVNATAIGGGGLSYGYGTYSGTSTSTTTTSGYMTADVVTKPGYTVGNHYPVLNVFAYDSNTAENVWYGSGVATSKTSDFRISSQALMVQLISQLPPSNALAAEILDNKTGQIGVDVAVVTLDGNNYFPAVIGFVEGSVATKSGLKLFDIVTEIDDRSTRNTAFADLARMAAGNSGDKLAITVWRMGSEHKLVLSLD